MSSNLPRRVLSLVIAAGQGYQLDLMTCHAQLTSLSLEYLDEYSRLVVSGSREDLRLLGRDDSVARDELGHDTAVSLDTEGEWADIDQDHILKTLFASKNTTLDGSTVSDSLIGVDTLRRLLAVEVLLEELLDSRDARGTTDQHDVIDFVLLYASILEDLLDRLHGLAEEIHVDFLEFGTCERFSEILAIEERFNVELGGHLGRQSSLCAFDFTLEFTHGTLVGADVFTIILALPYLDEVINDTVIEIFTTEMRVTSSS